METLSRSVQCMLMMAREFGREKVCMCVYFQRGMPRGENNEKRETFLPPSLSPALTLHCDIIVDFHQQYSPLQVHILHQARQMSKGTKSIVGN